MGSNECEGISLFPDMNEVDLKEEKKVKKKEEVASVIRRQFIVDRAYSGFKNRENVD